MKNRSRKLRSARISPGELGEMAARADNRRAFNPSLRDSAYIAALMLDVPKDAEDRDWKRQCKAGNIDRVLEHADEFGIDAADRKHLKEARDQFRS